MRKHPFLFPWQSRNSTLKQPGILMRCLFTETCVTQQTDFAKCTENSHAIA